MHGDYSKIMIKFKMSATKTIKIQLKSWWISSFLIIWDPWEQLPFYRSCYCVVLASSVAIMLRVPNHQSVRRNLTNFSLKSLCTNWPNWESLTTSTRWALTTIKMIQLVRRQQTTNLAYSRKKTLAAFVWTSSARQERTKSSSCLAKRITSMKNASQSGCPSKMFAQCAGTQSLSRI